MSTPTEHREVEFKFRIPQGVDIDLESIVAGSDLDAQQLAKRDMTATYYDTSNLSLIRWGITLRSRRGGGDDGWHMKIPADPTGESGARDEIHVDSTRSDIPRELASIAAPLVRRQEIVPMAIVQTQRNPIELRSGNGDRLIEIVDDHVSVSTPDADRPSARFHEVEVELLQDSPESRAGAKSICDALLTQGALSSSVSKAAQAFGPAAGDPPDVPALPHPSPQAPAIESLRAVFSSYVRDLLLADVGVRRGLPDSVHQMRIACRRLRSALRTFSPLLDADATSFLREELAWLASELGEVRDTEVQQERLCSLTDDEELQKYMQDFLGQRLRAAMSGALAALRSDRHDFLIEDLILLVSEPPVNARAFEPGAAYLRECMRKPWKRLRQSVQKAEAETSVTAWHDVRIRAKQARYATEALSLIFGKQYQKISRSLAKATDILGQRQDSHVSELVLRDIARDAPSHIAFELGRVTARNELAGNKDVLAFQRVWPDIVELAATVGLD